VVHSPIPPRSREVRVSDPFTGELTMRTVSQLSETASMQTYRKLISGDQLAVSSNGLYSAHVVTFRRGAEIVVHSELGVLQPRFQRDSPQEGTRILRVDGASALVWGKVEGHPHGIWKIDQATSAFLAPVEKLVRPRGHISPLLRGVSREHPGSCVYLTTGGNLWPVHEQALVSPMIDGLCIVERIGELLYAYSVSQLGEISPLRLLTLSHAQQAIDIVPWQGRLMLAVARGTQSWLVEINPRVSGERYERMGIDGELQGVWSSPGGNTLAMLVHPRGEPEGVRRLQLSNGRIVKEGSFCLDPRSMRWSPNEEHLAVKIREGEGLDRVMSERLVGTVVDRPLPIGIHLREFLVDDRGRLAAMITHDGVYDQPIINGQEGTMVPLAWNLHYAQDGSIAWTTVHADRILTWFKETPTRLLSTHAMR
jgi:hypothetical protein